MKRMTLSFFVALAFVVLGSAALIVSLKLPFSTPVTKIGGPGTFPTVFLIIIVVFSAILAVTEFLSASKTSESQASIKIEKKDVIRILLLIAAVTIYIAFLDTVGFIVFTPFLILVSLWLFGYRHIIISPVLAIGFTILMHLLFRVFLKISLP